MADYAELLKVIKQVGADATNAACPVVVCFGKVVNKSPLKINVDQKMTLGSAQLVLTKNVTDYEIEASVDWATEKSAEPEHKHNIKGKKKITIHNSLKAGDEVILLRQQGGQKYIVVDKVVQL